MFLPVHSVHRVGPALCVAALLGALCLAPPPLTAAAPPKPSAASAQAQAHVWNERGSAAYDAKDYARAADCFRHAAAFNPRLPVFVTNLATALQNLGKFAQAQAALEAARSSMQTLADRAALQTALADLHYAWAEQAEKTGKNATAAAHYQAAAAIDKTLRPHDAAIEWNGAGKNLYALSRSAEAIPLYRQALALIRRTKDRVSEQTILSNLGLAQIAVGDSQAAIGTYEQALALARKLNDRVVEGTTLSSLGLAYTNLSQYDQGLALINQALPLLHDAPSPLGEAVALNNRGQAYYRQSRFDLALADYRQALAVAQQFHNRGLEGTIQNNIGQALSDLGQYDQALAAFRQALTALHIAKDRMTEGTTLNNIGLAYTSLEQYNKAVKFYQQAFQVQMETKNYSVAAYTVNNLGSACEHLNMTKEAVDLYQIGLRLSRKTGDRALEARILSNLGLLYLNQNKYDLALNQFQPALALQREVGDRTAEGATLNNLMFTWGLQQRPRLAVFYGKQAVNAYQGIRQSIGALDAQTQKSYLAQHESTYRTLAELLIGEGRLPEAQQVLGLLKQEEYSQFVRGGDSQGAAGDAVLTPTETQWQARYAQIAGQITDLGRQSGVLRAKTHRTPDEEQQLTQLQADLDIAGQAFQKFLKDLATEFDSKQTARDKIRDIKDVQPLMRDLRELNAAYPDAPVAILYTVVGKDHLSVIFMTPDVSKAEQYPISATDLNAKILAFREAVQSPNADPRPLAEELYKIILGPVEKDLEQSGAKTLMWSLDGDLRYLPLAALYDGKQYLVERFRNTIFTPASQSSLKDAPQTNWKGLGMGVSKAQPGFNPLPAVPEELGGIIREGAATNGVLPGEVMLDGQFTLAAMRAALNQRYPVVHIASHFSFHPGGTDADSFLLLGDGTHLTLSQIESSQDLFDGVDLLTLSACNTAMGDTDADGREVDGLGILAQQEGAKSIIASLWPVADASTGVMMQQLYGWRQSHADAPKAEALRQAQLSLLHGTASPAAASGKDNRAGRAVEDEGDAANLPRFTPDPKAPYAHPYYWAPFVLIGNWR